MKIFKFAYLHMIFLIIYYLSLIHIFLEIIDRAETEKFGPDGEGADKTEDREAFRILAVTACPTGIAHTYMAQDVYKRQVLSKWQRRKHQRRFR